jgi:hypothetical protein
MLVLRGLAAFIATIPWPTLRRCHHKWSPRTRPACCGKCGRTLCPLCGRAVDAMRAHFSERHADALADLNTALKCGTL